MISPIINCRRDFPEAPLITPQSKGRYPRAGEQEVTVKPREFTSVEIHYDPGIR